MRAPSRAAFAQTGTKRLGQGARWRATAPKRATGRSRPCRRARWRSARCISRKGVKADGKPLAGRHVSSAPDADDEPKPARRARSRIARALGGVREGRQGRRPRGGDDHRAPTTSARSQKDTPPHSQQLVGRDAEGRRLRPRLDQQGRQQLPDPHAAAVDGRRAERTQPAQPRPAQTAITSNCS